jgi:hypothetical protein
MGIDRRRTTPWGTGPRLDLTIALLLLGLAAMVVGLVGLAKPITTIVPTTKSFQQSGVLSYHGAAGSDSVYPSGQVQTGQAVLINQIHDLTVTFSYQQTAGPSAQGSMALSAVLNTGEDLSRTIALQPVQAFHGSSFAQSAVIHPADLAQEVQLAQQAANQGSGGATLTITPSVSVRGTLVGQPFNSAFAPQFVFDLTATSLVPASPPAPPAGQASPTYNGFFQASQPSAVPTVATGSTRVTVLFWHLPDRNARLLGVAGAVLFLAALLVGLPVLRRRQRLSPSDRTEAAFGSLLVPISDLRDHFGPTVDLLGADDLKVVATKYESVVMVQHQASHSVYSVWDNGVLYRYVETYPAPVAAIPGIEPADPLLEDAGHRRA